MATVAGTVVVSSAEDPECDSVERTDHVDGVSDRYDEHLEKAEAIEHDVESVQRTIQIQQTAETIVEFVVEPFRVDKADDPEAIADEPKP